MTGDDLALHYLDTSALVKLYINEPGTTLMLRLADPAAGHQFAILAITEVEFRSAVRRREREGDIETDLAKQLLSAFAVHLGTAFLRQPLNDALLDTAGSIVDRHALRAYDALQLAGCLMLGSASVTNPVFVCSDNHLLRAAQAEGLDTLDPIQRP